jgi:hypothetical protein
MRDRKIPFHPPLFALFPILSLFAQNRGILVASDLVHPVALALGCCIGVWAVLAIVGKSPARAALATSWLFLAFYSFPAVREGLSSIASLTPATTLIAWSVAVLPVSAAILCSGRDLQPIHRILNVAASVAIAPPVVLSVLPAQLDPSPGAAPARAMPAHTAASCGADETSGACREPSGTKIATHAEKPRVATGPDAESHLAERPNIYYIILDGYARHDVLSRYYDLDNEPFLRALEERGFYVARRSQSNYAQTYLSLSSSLNSTYLDDVARRVGAHSGDRAPLREMIADNRAAAFLRRRGYEFVVFSSGYTGTEIPEADVYLEPPGAMSELGQLLRASSPLPTLDEALGRGDLRHRAHRERVDFTLGELPIVARKHEPAFVFAHVFSPHPPFVFGPNGEVRGTEKEFSTSDGGPFEGDEKAEYVRGYRDQLQFLNRRVLEAIDGILASERPAIIVLQGDHGPGSCWEHASMKRSDPRERFSILNAYYFPDRHYGRLYQEINPVNSFKVIFNQFFEAREPLLEERSYASTWTRPYGFIDVTEKLSGEGAVNAAGAEVAAAAQPSS